MIRFYFHPTPNPAKIALFLEEAGLAYETVPVDTMKGELHQPAFRAINPDPEEKAQADHAEFGWRFPLGYGLTVAQMQALGLYVSNPRSPQETDRPFSEPGLFLINPAGQVQLIDISNAPFARPDLAGIARGAKRIQEMNYPIRGTLA